MISHVIERETCKKAHKAHVKVYVCVLDNDFFLFFRESDFDSLRVKKSTHIVPIALLTALHIILAAFTISDHLLLVIDRFIMSFRLMSQRFRHSFPLLLVEDRELLPFIIIKKRYD